MQYAGLVMEDGDWVLPRGIRHFKGPYFIDFCGNAYQIYKIEEQHMRQLEANMLYEYGAIPIGYPAYVSPSGKMYPRPMEGIEVFL